MVKTVTAVGEMLWDMMPSGPVLGGAPFNFMYRMNSLGVPGQLISRVGSDDLGRQALERMPPLGMDNRLIQIDEKKPTGKVNVTLDPLGDPVFEILPDQAYDYMQNTFDGYVSTSECECFYYGTLALRSPKSRDAIEMYLDACPQAVKVLDLNLRRDCFSPEVVKNCLDQADVLKVNELEILYLSELLGLSKNIYQLCRELREMWVLYRLVLTLGSRGAYVISSEEGEHYAPGYKIDVADTVGSGDAFFAGFLYKLMQKKSPQECCEFGNALGTLVCTQTGATTPIALAEVEAFMQQDHERKTDPRIVCEMNLAERQ